MSVQEKKAVFNLVSTILILGSYLVYVFGINGSENLPQINDPQFWGKFMLLMVGVTIVLKIIAYIIFFIILKANNEEEDPEFMDEYDKRIEMKSDRNANHFFMLGFMISWIPLAMGKPISYMFITLLISGFTAGILGDLWKLYYYKKGL
jgi:nitric oxide reductase large subunit